MASDETVETQAQKCERCNADGLRDDEDCPYYGEPNGCNSPIYGKYPTDEKSSVVGNAARMREAVVLARDTFDTLLKSDGDADFVRAWATLGIDAMNAALSVPRRNCDVGTAEGGAR